MFTLQRLCARDELPTVPVCVGAASCWAPGLRQVGRGDGCDSAGVSELAHGPDGVRVGHSVPLDGLLIESCWDVGGVGG